MIVIWEAAAQLAHPFLTDDFHQMVKKAMTEMYLPNSNTWVYVKDNVVLGFVAMIDNEIGGLFVNPEMHGKGIGHLGA